jgi:hypothetical protein
VPLIPNIPSYTRWWCDLVGIQVQVDQKAAGARGRVLDPEGAADDDTRRSEYYDGTFSYLKSLGLPLI